MCGRPLHKRAPPVCGGKALGMPASRGADPVAGCRSSSPDPWTDGPEYCGWKQFCQYGGTDTEGRCNRPVSLLRLGAPPLQCWPGHAECPWREEILPVVNIARGARRHPPPLTESAQGVMRIPASHLQTGNIVSINRPAVSLRSTGHQRFGPGRSSLRMALAGGTHVHQ